MLHRFSHRSFAMLAIALISFGGTMTGAQGLKVVTSIKPVHSLASAVMEGIGTPVLLIRGAVSPHNFNLRPSDARHISEADLIFVIGEGIESSLVRHIDSIAIDASVVHLAEIPDLPLLDFRTEHDFGGHDEHGHDEGHKHEDEHGHDEHGHDEGHKHEDEHGHDEHDHGDFDPHVWTDPAIAQILVGVMARTLAEKDPDNAARYAENAARLIDRLRALDAEIARITEPIRGRPYIVFHDAYQYFETRYGLNSVDTILLSPEQMPSANRLQAVRQRLQETGAVCVFREPQFNDNIVNVILEGTAVRTGIMDPLGADLEDGPDLYFMLIHNMALSLRACLDGA